MYWAEILLFQQYAAYLTASSKDEFLKLFAEIVENAITQYEHNFGISIGQKKKDEIRLNLLSLQKSPPGLLDNLSFDINMDADGMPGIISVNRIFRSKEEIYKTFQPWVDDLNEGSDFKEDEKWKVFGGGFFPEFPGYEIDELFK